MVETEQRVGESVLDRLKAHGHIIERQGRQFVLYAGLLDVATQSGLKELKVTPVQIAAPENNMSAVMLATAIFEDGREFSEIGDADPTNVTRMIVPHVNRMAATRAKARVLRDAINIGVTAFEELGEEDGSGDQQGNQQPYNAPAQPAARPVQVPQAMLNEFEQNVGMQQTTAQRTNYNRPPAAAPRGGQQQGNQQRQFQPATGPTGRPASPRQIEILSKPQNVSFEAPGIPPHDEAITDSGLASMRMDAIFAQPRQGGGDFR